jgi:hypothetical protein
MRLYLANKKYLKIYSLLFFLISSSICLLRVLFLMKPLTPSPSPVGRGENNAEFINFTKIKTPLSLKRGFVRRIS